jgi:hypothetical protein
LKTETSGVDRRKFLQECVLGAAFADALPYMNLSAVAGTATRRDASRKWYQRSYRRLLYNMHIPDWSDEVLSQLRPEEVVEDLLVGDVTAVSYMFVSHTGLAYYPTKVGQMHRVLQATGRDVMRELVDLSHRKGLDVIAYYCLIYTNWYWDTHPEARSLDANGKTERPTGLNRRHASTLCLNNQGYRDYVVAQLTEVCQNYDIQGFWLDMTWWPMVCCCRTCQRKYASEIGGEIPRTVDWQDPAWVKFQRKRQEWLLDFAHLATSTIRKLKPEATVVHQSGALAGGGWVQAASAALANETDWLSADTYTDKQGQSYIFKLFHGLSAKKPFENANCWTIPLIREICVARTEEDLRCRVFASFINDGAWMWIDEMHPKGSLNRVDYGRSGKIFGELERYEPHAGGTFRQDIAIYHSYDSSLPNRFKVQSASDLASSEKPRDATISASEHQNARVNMARVLLENHFPFGVITRKDLRRLSDFQIVILPNVAMMNQEEVEAFREYVRQGGSLYASKYTSLLTTDGVRQKDFLLSDLFGVSYLGETKELVTYVDASEKYAALFSPFRKWYPATLRDSQAIVRAVENAEVIATVTLPYTDPEDYPYASILTEPPGVMTDHPSVVLNKYGNGKVMYSAGAIEIWDYETQRIVLGKLLRLLALRPVCFETDAPKPVEVTMFEQPDKKRFIIHLLNWQQDLPNIPVDRINLKVRMDQKVPAELVVLPEGKRVNYAFKDGRVEFTAPRLDTYTMLALNYK